MNMKERDLAVIQLTHFPDEWQHSKGFFYIIQGNENSFEERLCGGISFETVRMRQKERESR